MKRSIRIRISIACCVLLAPLLSAQSITERAQALIPKHFSTNVHLPEITLSSLYTPEALSNALQRITSAFTILSPKALLRIQKNQLVKLQANLEAYAENPSWANRGAVAANALALTATTLALAGQAAAVAGVGYMVGKKINE
ncbi:MAG: hypothetical protein ACD_64C00051G0004 [uncultured bacterium]|nr:MAG: hypothetical protein ACD_64C00051G0004 [uncultured bacterium]